MKGIKRSFILVVVVALVSCAQEEAHPDYENIAKRSKKYFEEDKGKESKNFVFPDSVMNRSIIATYFEEEAGAHSAMFYTDTSKKFAQVVRYFPDKNILTDKVKCLSENEFVSVPRPEIKYIVSNERVVYTCWRGDHQGIAFSFDHLRTDANRY